MKWSEPPSDVQPFPPGCSLLHFCQTSQHHHCPRLLFWHTKTTKWRSSTSSWKWLWRGKGSNQEGYFSRTRWLERQDRFRCLPTMTKTITVSKFDLHETESKGWRLMKLAQSHKLTKYNTIHAHEDSRKVVQYNLVYNQIVFIMLSWGFTSDMNKDKTNLLLLLFRLHRAAPFQTSSPLFVCLPVASSANINCHRRKSSLASVITVSFSHVVPVTDQSCVSTF